jgi:hypothetical protein
VPYPDIARCVSTTRASGEKDRELGRGPGLRQCLPQGVRASCICLTFLVFQMLEFYNKFYLLVFKDTLVDALILR